MLCDLAQTIARTRLEDGKGKECKNPYFTLGQYSEESNTCKVQVGQAFCIRCGSSALARVERPPTCHGHREKVGRVRVLDDQAVEEAEDLAARLG